MDGKFPITDIGVYRCMFAFTPATTAPVAAVAGASASDPTAAPEAAPVPVLDTMVTPEKKEKKGLYIH